MGKRTADVVEYLELVHNWGHIRISANHLIYVGGKMRPAADVNIGDQLLWLPGQDKSPVLSTVMEIRTVMAAGYHAPLTFSGVLFVVALNQTANLIDFEESNDGEIHVLATVGEWDDTFFEVHCSPAEDSDCD